MPYLFAVNHITDTVEVTCLHIDSRTRMVGQLTMMNTARTNYAWAPFRMSSCHPIHLRSPPSRHRHSYAFSSLSAAESRMPKLL